MNETEGREELLAVGAVQLGVYKSYFEAVRSVVYLVFMEVMFFCSQGLVTTVDLYISQW